MTMEFDERLITCKDVQERCNNWVESQRDFIYDPDDETFRKRKTPNEYEEWCNTDSEFDSVSECGAKKRRVGIHLKDEVYHLVCDWLECHHETNHVERFVKHVANHIPELKVKVREDQTEVYVCQWNGCFYESIDPDEICRHVNYHAFHTKLKCIGSNIRGRIKLPRCRRDPEWKNIVDLPAPLLCRWEECLENFRNYQMYIYHVAAHVNVAPRGTKLENSFECRWTGCRNVFPSVYKLRDHVRRHTKEKIVACPDCGSTFASNTKFHVHCKRQIPIDVQGFQCSHCNKFYPTEGILRDHMRLHVFNYKCTLCEMSCESPASLAKHVRYRHISTRNFPCQLCDHAAKSQQDLDSHMTVHTNGPNFSCHYDGCPYTCKGAYTLDRHIERIHGQQIRWYCCHECPIKYRKSHRLTRHLIEAHKLQLPSGHKRFQYTHDEDGCYRLQMVRYEAIEEENNPCVEVSRLHDKRYTIKLKSLIAEVPEVEVIEDTERNEDEIAEIAEIEEAQEKVENVVQQVLEEVEEEEEKEKEKDSKSDHEGNEGKSMPIISNILISIDETDAQGNVITSKIVEAQETTELPVTDVPPLILT